MRILEWVPGQNFAPRTGSFDVGATAATRTGHAPRGLYAVPLRRAQCMLRVGPGKRDGRARLGTVGTSTLV